MPSSRRFFSDYAPKVGFTVVCIAIPPVVQIGVPFTVQLQFESPNQFVWMDAGGPMAFVRQQQ